ncbi:MAG: GatB/YqeY domain-containing protein [Luteitalea sp.]|nr:GatB/YqeY domain-containing protein [Luteitalea sp.]
MRPASKARRPRILGIFEGGATPLAGMQRRPNAKLCRRHHTNEDTMDMINQVNADLTAALRARDQRTADALRLLKTALTNKRVELKHDPDEREALQVVATLVKQRRESIDQFAAAGRTDLADRERREAAVLEHYLPAAVPAEEVSRIVDEAIGELGASSPRDLGAVMKLVMGRLAGRLVDGKSLNQLVRDRLGS